MKKVKVLISALMCMLLMVGVCSCGGEGASPNKAPKINVEDIEWKVTEKITDGERVPRFSFKNNTKYDVLGINLKFVVKEDMTEKELSANAEIKEKAESMEHPIEETTIDVSTEKYTKAGEVCEDIYLSLDGTFETLSNKDTMDLFDPDFIQIAYIVGDKICVANYDYKNKEMSYEEELKDAVSWSESDLAKSINKPEVPLIYIDWEDESDFNVVCLGASKEIFDTYVKSCKEKGYTEKVETSNYSDSSSYEAENKEGYKLEVSYYSYENTMRINVEK